MKAQSARGKIGGKAFAIDGGQRGDGAMELGRRLKRAATVGAFAFAAAVVLANARRVVSGTWMPIGAMFFIAIAVGLVAAVVDLLLAGPKPRGKVQPASAAPVASLPRAEPARRAIVFRQQVPPAHDPTHLSQFGGLPRVPQGFAWPTWTHAGAEEPLHFLMQVDCAAMPAAAHEQGFPARGVLYFFLDLRWGHSNGFRVLHSGEGVESLAPAVAPANLAPAYGAEARYAWRWTEGLDDPATRCPNLLPRWPFDPVAVEIPEAERTAWHGDEESPVFWWPGDTVMAPVLLAAQEAGSGAAEAAEPAGFARSFADWPQDWRAIEIAAALLLKTGARLFRRGAGDPGLRALTEEERQAMADRLGREARQWLAQAADQPPFAVTPPETRAAFWSWLESWRDFAIFMIKDAAVLSIEASLSASAAAAARLPAEAIARIYTRHALAARTKSGIFAPTPDRMLAPPSDVQGGEEEIAQTHLLLLELSSNEGIGHHFGEGVYQFWITPADLRARRFDRTQLTTSAY